MSTSSDAALLDLGKAISLDAFCAALARPTRLVTPSFVLDRLTRDRTVVDRAAAGPDPVYGLNTGLGGNLGHRLDPMDIAAFQRQVIEGRAVAVGPPLPADAGRGLLLARLVSAARGGSGMSPAVFAHLCAVFDAGLAPAVPRYGSIGASDLTQNAVWALSLLGTGEMWCDGALIGADLALARRNLVAPPLQPKDGMALINHGGLTVALAATALGSARRGLSMARAAALLSLAGYGANPAIFGDDVNSLRAAPGQLEAARWFAARLAKDVPPRRVQDALGFRVAASVLGAVSDVLDRACLIWADEVNGLSDSPAVLGDQAMRSTPNFQAPALALALASVAQAMAMLANGAVQRAQRMMTPELSGLPKYLSPVGGASAGMVPMQKTAAALLAEIRRHAMPVPFDPAPVSESVEDMAPMTPQAAQSLLDQAEPFALLCGYEALVAAQAIDLRNVPLSDAVSALHAGLRAGVPTLVEDTPQGFRIAACAERLITLAEPLCPA